MNNAILIRSLCDEVVRDKFKLADSKSFQDLKAKNCKTKVIQVIIALIQNIRKQVHVKVDKS